MAVTQPSIPQHVLTALFADEPSAVVWFTDQELRLCLLSGGVLSTLGIEHPDPMNGELIETAFEQEDDPDSMFMVAHQSALAGGLAACEFKWRGWQFRGRVMPQLDDDGGTQGCLGVAFLHATIDGLEEALDASERRFETLVGMSPAGIYMTDEAGRCTYVNRRWCEMAGLSADEALGHSWERAIHPDDRIRVATRWRRAMEAHGVWGHMYRLFSPTGVTTWVLGQARPMFDGDQQVAGYVGIAIDISERKKADQQLRESERRFARLLSAVTSYRYSVQMSDGIPIDTEHSTSCVGTTGYSPDDYAQDTYLWINMVHPDDRALVIDHTNKVLGGQSVPPLEHRIYHKGGSVVWVRDTIIPHCASDGQLLRYDGLVEDITDRKRVERRLWQILESAPDAMVIADQSGNILLTNCQVERLFGYRSEELIHRPVEILIPQRFQHAHAQHRKAFTDAPEMRQMTKRPDLFGRRKDGSEFAAEISLSPIEMDDEVLVCAGIRDISHRRAIERAMEANLQIQSTMATLLKLSLERVDLSEKMERSLALLFTVPWLETESSGAIFLVQENECSLTMAVQRGLPAELLEQSLQVALDYCQQSEAAGQDSSDCAPAGKVRYDLHYRDVCGRGHYCVPIRSDETLLGMLNLFVAPGTDRPGEETRFLEAAANVLAGVITRSRAEESLRSSEERFDLAVKGTDAGVWDWDLRTHEVYFSPRWKGMLGYADDEIPDDLDEWRQRIHPEDQERSRATVQAYLDGETEHYELEHRLQHRDGTYRWILARGAVVRDLDGRPCRMVGSHLDITDRKNAEEQLRYREAQLIAAQRIQEHLLPSQAPDVDGFEIAGRVVPAQFAGGDYYDFLSLADGTMAIIVGDVSGHDVSAALVMASASAHLRSFAEDHSSVQDIVEHTNSILSRETDDGRFVTLFALQLDVERRTIRFVNAGHPHAYVLSENGRLKATLCSTSFPLAVLPDTQYQVSDPMELASGDMLLLITDGILEARSPDGDCYSSSLLVDVVRQHQHLPAAAIIDAILEEVRRFTGDAEAQDDLTIVAVKVA